jgi:hypothetical protein
MMGNGSVLLVLHFCLESPGLVRLLVSTVAACSAASFYSGSCCSRLLLAAVGTVFVCSCSWMKMAAEQAA